MNYQIAILHHEFDNLGSIGAYAINALADIWRKDGHTVINLFGIRKFIPADLIIVHVDLSVVPAEYITFAERYPIVLNGKAQDIRKSSFSRYLLQKDDPYTGPVFIKSNTNSAGMSESRLRKFSLFGFSTGQYTAKVLNILQYSFASNTIHRASDYLVVGSLQEVSPKWFKRKNIVIQKFCPEFEDGLYHTRFYNFLGDHGDCMRISSREPVVNIRSSVSVERSNVHPKIEKMRRDLQFDYGKFDYVIHEGEPVLLDINKTTGTSTKLASPELKKLLRHRASGLYSYFR